MIAPTDPRTPRVVLVGPPGAGKSTIGRKLAKELGVDLYDTDAGIERETGRTIPEIFAEDGEPEFRRIEERVVRRAILAERGVVSLGGGAVLSANTRALLRNRTVVYLEISVAEGLRRTGASNQRPLLNGDDPGAKYRELLRARRPLYREVATVRVRTDGRSPGRVVRMILSRLGIPPATTDPEPGTTTESAPAGPGSSRSRARRRARARAAARRRAAATDGETGSAAASDTTGAHASGISCETATTAGPGPAADVRAIPAPADGSSSMRSTPSADVPADGTTGFASPEDAAANSTSGTGGSPGATRRRRPRRRRPQPGGNTPTRNQPPPEAIAAPVPGATDSHDPADEGVQRSEPGNASAGTNLDCSGVDGSGADLAGGPVTGPNHPGAGTPADRAPGRNRRSRRRGTGDGSGGARSGGTPEKPRPVSPEVRAIPDAPTAQESDPAAGTVPGGRRARRGRGRRARNGGAGARSGESGARANASALRGAQNARGGASKQTARTESEQQS